MAARKYIHATVLAIDKGIIYALVPSVDGMRLETKFYLQRGVYKLTPEQQNIAMRTGKLAWNFREFEELPSNISLHYEDPEVQGKKPRASFTM